MSEGRLSPFSVSPWLTADLSWPCVLRSYWPSPSLLGSLVFSTGSQDWSWQLPSFHIVIVKKKKGILVLEWKKMVQFSEKEKSSMLILSSNMPLFCSGMVQGSYFGSPGTHTNSRSTTLLLCWESSFLCTSIELTLPMGSSPHCISHLLLKSTDFWWWVVMIPTSNNISHPPHFGL